MRDPVICLMGPTSSGKTDLALELADEFPIEIINVDSAQIYRQMDIGSGKPDKDVLQAIKHHLIDILDPKESYSAWQFRNDALEIIKDIKARKKIPLLVGGTMLYFKALQVGFSTLPASTPEVRTHILERANEKGWQALYEELQTIDPVTAKRLSPQDKQRVSRALEVYEMTRIPLSQWHLEEAPEKTDLYNNIALIPLTTPRSVLHERIRLRFVSMLQKGLIDEVQSLKARGDLHASMPSIRAVGYRQVWEYLDGAYSFEEMKEKAIASTRQLAKRQLTWLRHWPELEEMDFLDKNVKAVLKKKLSCCRQQES